MSGQWGNGGGHGRRITDYEDEPIGEVSKTTRWGEIKRSSKVIGSKHMAERKAAKGKVSDETKNIAHALSGDDLRRGIGTTGLSEYWRTGKKGKNNFSKREGEHRGRRAAMGAAGGAALGHAPLAGTMAEGREEINEATAMFGDNEVRAGRFHENYRPEVIRRVLGKNGTAGYRKLIGGAAAAGATAGVLSTGRRHIAPKKVVDKSAAPTKAEMKRWGDEQAPRSRQKNARTIGGAAVGGYAGHMASGTHLHHDIKSEFKRASKENGVHYESPKLGEILRPWHKPRPVAQMLKMHPKYGAGIVAGTAIGGMAGAGVLQKKKLVDKAARYYDADARRQRRAGMYQAGLAGSGTISAGLGVHGIRNSTKKVRALNTPGRVMTSPKVAEVPAVGTPGKAGHVAAKPAQKAKFGPKPGGTHPEVKRLLSARKRDIALVGAGAAGIAGAGLVRQKSEGRKFGIWR